MSVQTGVWLVFALIAWVLAYATAETHWFLSVITEFALAGVYYAIATSVGSLLERLNVNQQA